ncbi:MAG: dnaX 2, partial [Frankiales bacterium]|nr:dnaX 2 [Frankiales bacterium]
AARAPVGGAPASPASPGLDATGLRAAWDDVLAAVKSRKRTAHAQLADAQVASVTGGTLVLAFQHAPILRQFQASTGPDVLREALQEALGAQLALTCVLHESLGAHAHPGPAGRAAGAPQSPRVEPDFAPGDEAVPDDPDAPPEAPTARGEDAALELVRTQLGGRVVSSSGDA